MQSSDASQDQFPDVSSSDVQEWPRPGLAEPDFFPKTSRGRTDPDLLTYNRQTICLHRRITGKMR
jgi:hypothetical protein